MKILITENQLKKLIENIINERINPNIELEKEKFYKESAMKIWFMENIVDKSKEMVKSEWPDFIFYVDKDTGHKYMDYNKKYGELYIDRETIWSYFYNNYSTNNMEIIRLIKDLMLEYYGLWDVTPYAWNL